MSIGKDSVNKGIRVRMRRVIGQLGEEWLTDYFVAPFSGKGIVPWLRREALPTKPRCFSSLSFATGLPGKNHPTALI